MFQLDILCLRHLFLHHPNLNFLRKYFDDVRQESQELQENLIFYLNIIIFIYDLYCSETVYIRIFIEVLASYMHFFVIHLFYLLFWILGIYYLGFLYKNLNFFLYQTANSFIKTLSPTFFKKLLLHNNSIILDLFFFEIFIFPKLYSCFSYFFKHLEDEAKP